MTPQQRREWLRGLKRLDRVVAHHPHHSPRPGTVEGTDGAIYVQYDSDLDVGTYVKSDGRSVIGNWKLEPEREE